MRFLFAHFMPIDFFFLFYNIGYITQHLRSINESKMMRNEEIDPSIEPTDSSSVRYMSTLPDFFNDTIGKSLKIENFKPQNMIE